MDELKIEDGNYLVSFIDILGFKKRIKDNSQFPNLEKVYNSLDRVLYYLPEVHRTGLQNKYYSIYAGKPLSQYAEEILKNRYNFSDSIIFYIKCSDIEEEYTKQLFAISWITNAFIIESLIHDDRVFQLPLRGAIAYGPALMDRDKKIHIGQPIVNAVELSGYQDWVGGALHHSVTIPQTIIENLVGYNKQIYEYPSIPIKDCCQEKHLIKYALNWVQQHPAGVKWFKERKGKQLRPLLRDICYHIEKHDWGTHLEKKENTKKFAEKICDEYDTNGII